MLAAPMQGAGDSLLSQVLSAAVKRGLVEPKQHVVCVLSVRGDLVLNVCQVDEKGSGLKSNLASLGGSPDCSQCCDCKRCVSWMRSRESLDWRPLHFSSAGIAGSSVYGHPCCFRSWSSSEDSPVPRVHTVQLTDCSSRVCSAS